jgi:hypothetical protein
VESGVFRAASEADFAPFLFEGGMLLEELARDPLGEEETFLDE